MDVANFLLGDVTDVDVETELDEDRAGLLVEGIGSKRSSIDASNLPGDKTAGVDKLDVEDELGNRLLFKEEDEEEAPNAGMENLGVHSQTSNFP